VGDQVEVSGYVTSQAQKEAAIAAARRVKGVGRVADELCVALPRRAAVDLAPEHRTALTRVDPRPAAGCETRR
jgi:hypothetical protein